MWCAKEIRVRRLCGENERAKHGEKESLDFVVTKKKKEKRKRERKKKEIERETHSWRFHLEQLDEREKKKGLRRTRCGGIIVKDHSFSGCFLFDLQRRVRYRRDLRRERCRGGTRRFIEPETQQHAEQHTAFRGDRTLSAL